MNNIPRMIYCFFSVIKQTPLPMLKVLTTFCLLFLTTIVSAQTQLIKNLEAGKRQTIVFYGTSLTAGNIWVAPITNRLKAKYGTNKVNAINSGLSGKSSYTGRQELDNRVLAHNPDTVFIEFSANDSNLGHRISIQQANAHLNNMIDRILANNANTEIIVQTMNPAWGRFGDSRPNMAGYMQGHRDVAAARNLMLIDHYPNWLKLQRNNRAQFEAYIPDGIHPIKVGYAAIVDSVIEQALNGGVSNPGPVPTPVPSSTIDQCNFTSECKATFGSTANDCKNSHSSQSICMCGSQRCDVAIKGSLIPGVVQAEDYTNFFDTTVGNNGGQFRNDNVDIQATTDAGAGYNVGWIAGNEWLEFPISVLQNGTYSVDARVASAVGNGMFTVEINGVSRGTYSIGNTGGWQKWQTLNVPIGQLNRGRYTLRVQVQAGNFNLNWLNLKK